MTAMLIYYPFGDGKAEAGAFEASGFVGSVEAVKHMGDVGFGHADAAVLDLEVWATARYADAEQNFVVLFGVFGGVAYKDSHSLFEHAGIGIYC